MVSHGKEEATERDVIMGNPPQVCSQPAHQNKNLEKIFYSGKNPLY
jgi:hypothetical protein